MKHPNDKNVIIRKPSSPSEKDVWHDNSAVSTFIPGQDIPKEFYSRYSPDVVQDLSDPHPKEGFRAAGTITFFDDRIMCIHPTNNFGDYDLTFPKGRIDETDTCLQYTAIRETWEETGIRVQLTRGFVDARKSKGMVRYYFAVPYCGCFSDMCWETQAVSLVPINMISNHIKAPSDLPIVKSILEHHEQKKII